MKFKIPEKFKHLSVRTKRITALSVCVLLLGAAIFQNVRHREGSSSLDAARDGAEMRLEEAVGVSVIEDSEEYFAQMRLSRMNEESALSEEYRRVTEDAAASDSAVTEAAYMIETLNTLTSCEEDLEKGIKALGYQDVFAALALDGEVDITVLAESLNESDVNTIANMVTELADVSPDQITVRGVCVN